MADNIVVLGDRRGEKSSDWTPAELLRFMLAEIEAGRLELRDVVVSYVRADNHSAYYSAGKMSNFAQVGLLHATQRLLMED